MFENLKNLVFLLFTPIFFNAQEICDNGVDDNGNGLIDLNDPECECGGFGFTQDVPSLIPNSSFEDFSCCPYDYAELNCAEDWIQASNPTSDFWHNCGTSWTADYGSPGPNPDGDGIAGFINRKNWKEYIGACLLQPMIAGKTYILDFYLGFAMGSIPIDITFFGTTTCVDLPFNDGCPVGEGNWMELTSVNADGPGWVNLQVTFTPTVDIFALVIGPDCATGPTQINYYYLDGLTLAETNAFTNIEIIPSGDLCSNDYHLTASTDTSGGTWQWYNEGVALVGETNAVLDLNGNNLVAGEYSAMYTVGTECDKNSYVVETLPYPIANFDNTTVCEGIAIDFTDLSISDTNNIVGWEWDFTSNGIIDDVNLNPSYTYGSSGIYDATLTVINDVGCSHDTTIQVTVQPMPETEFDFLNQCDGFEVIFNNTTQIAIGNITDWSWSFGDTSGASTTENTSYLYAGSGQYNVILTATSNQGCVASHSETVKVYENPTADFNFTNTCDLSELTFVSNSNGNGGVLDSYEWDVQSDGNVDYTGISGEHIYFTEGFFDLTHIVTTEDGCSDTVQQEATVYTLPQASFEIEEVCEGSQSEFIDNSFVDPVNGDVISDWEWNFGEGTTSNSENPKLIYNNENVYNVELIVTTNHGCKDTLEQMVTVWPLPEVDFSPTDVCLDSATDFTDESTISNDYTNNTNIQWYWDFGDGGAANVQNPSYTYQAAGEFNTTLTVTSNNGCVNDTILPVTVNPKPEAKFVGVNLQGCSPVCPEIVSTSTVDSPSFLAEFEWRLDGNIVQNGLSASFGECIENNNGSIDFYDLKLEVTSNEGCLDTFVKTDFIQVYHNPIADFSFTPSKPDVLNTEVHFLNTSLYADFYDWTFYSVGESSQINPIIEYPAEAEEYDVRLVTTTEEGCTDTAKAVVNINDRIVFYVPNTFTPDGNSINNLFQPVFTSGFEPRDINLLIFNRWGELVYETDNMNKGWDGNYKNLPVPEGTYIWKIEFTETMSDKRHVETGHVNVLR